MAYATTYINDIVMFTNEWMQHLHALKAILGELKVPGMTANPRKCKLAVHETKYLGFSVGRGMIRPVKDKAKVIRCFQEPHNRRQLRSFLGLINYYQRFISHFADLATSLTDAPRGRAAGALQWTPEMAESFESLKEAMCRDVVVHTPDFSAPFILQTDTSSSALGAILLQQWGREECLIAFSSHKLNSAEVRYTTIEKDCLAIRWAKEYFRYYLMRREFQVVTDHAPLQWLMKAHIENAQITHWALALQPFKFTGVQHPGKDNLKADFLSRYINQDEPAEEA